MYNEDTAQVESSKTEMAMVKALATNTTTKKTNMNM